MAKPKITIDVVSDVVCPWCYIGKRRLEKAMTTLQDEFEFEVVYHPFELNPDMPESGTNQRQYLSDKFGGEERYEQITAHTTQVASGEGLHFDFSRQAVSPNTRKAHVLIQAARDSGKQPAITEAFFKAYFTDGVDLSSSQNIVDICTANGLSAETATQALVDDSLAVQVAMEERELQKLGIRGVPFYIIDKKYGVSGAQATETFIETFRGINKERATEGDACDVEEKNC